jgi:hypothetical protein
MNLTKDEQETLRRHLDLSTRIANCGDPVEAKRLAKDENPTLSEGIKDRGRMTLTNIATVARYLVRPTHPDTRNKKKRKLVEDLAALPEFQAMGENLDRMKALLLD